MDTRRMDDSEEIDLQRYLQVVQRYWWLVVAGPVVAGLVALAFVLNATPYYQATSRVLVQTGGSGQGLGLSEALARSYTELVRTTPILQTTADDLDLDMRPAELRSLISAGMVSNTQILEIRVRYTDPAAAAAIANTLTDVFIDYVMQQRLEEIARLQAAAQAQGVGDLSAFINTQLQATNSLTVIEPAIPPTGPEGGRGPLVVLVSSAMGLMVAVMAAFVVHHLRDRVESPELIEQRFGLISLGIVDLWSGKEAPVGTLVMATAPNSRFAEEFRHIRAGFQFTAGPTNAKSITVTSPGPGEGKTTVVSNLAVALAQDGKRVVAVDGDLRRPSLHQVFDLPNGRGLSNYLAVRDMTPDAVIQPSGVENLAVVTSGPHPPNPAELLGSERLRALLEHLVAEADFVLVDTPPALAAADASLLASRTDGTVLVADAQQTRSGALASTAQYLNRANARILGVVLDKMRRPRFGSGYGYYYHYYSSNGTGDSSSNGTGGSRRDGTGPWAWADAPRRWARQSLERVREKLGRT